MTNYPAQIDNSISLPAAVDNLTPVQASVVNNLRSAILAIESALGTSPGTTYGSVSARLGFLETTVGNLKIIELQKDLGNTLEDPFVIGIWGRPISSAQPNANDVLTWDGIAWAPLPQTGGGGGGGITTLVGDVSAGPGAGAQIATVKGLQGRPVASTAPTVNQVLTWNGSAWVPGAGGGGASFTCNFGVSPTLVQVGHTIPASTLAFTASYTNPTTPTSAILTDSDGNGPQDVTGTPNSFTSAFSYFFNTYGAVETFTLTASNGTTTLTPTATVTWTQKVYWGVGPAGGGNGAFIQALANSQLQTTQDGTFSTNAGVSQKVYYAYRTGYGTASFAVGGFSGGFTLDSTTISVTNSDGFTENYTLYESDNVGLGAITFVVTHP